MHCFVLLIGAATVSDTSSDGGGEHPALSVEVF